MGDEMEIRNLYTFKEILETGSFSKAARNLGYTQSTTSTHIQMLESHYGKKLFDRVGKKVKVTSFGLELASKLELFLNSYEEIENFHKERSAVTGTIRIGAPDSLMMYQLYKVIYEYKRKYPKVNIVITNGLCPDLRKQVESGELDICMMLQPLGEYGNLKVHALRRESFSLIFPRGQSEAYLPTDEQMVIIAEEGCTYREVFLHYLASRGYSPANLMETGSVEAIKKYVIDGLGVSYVPTYAIENERKEGKLIAVEYESDLVFYTQLLYHQNKWLNPAMESLIDMICDKISS